MLKIAGLVHDSIVDGPGLRITIFTQGCPHHCEGCQNPETWSFEGGYELEIQDLLDEIEKNPLCKGVTLSGGEPFVQAGELAGLGRILKERGYEIAAYTGYTFEQLQSGTKEQKELLETIDILVDGRFELEKRSLDLNFRGSANQRILNVPESLKTGRAVEETGMRWAPQQ